MSDAAVLESLIALRGVCGGGKSKGGDCYRARCKRCRRGRVVALRRQLTGEPS